VSFFSNLLQSSQAGRIRISEEVSAFFDSINAALRKHSPLFDGPLSKNDRRNILDDLGAAGSEYRTGIYNCGCTNRKREIAVASLLDFCRLSLRAIDHSIRANKRKDKLYHAYNLMTVEEDGGISIRTLYEMLEGQVAIVSSGFLRAEEAAEVLDALRASALYREDQCSYLLYPDRRLPRFAEKNNIPEKEFRGSELLQKLVADGNTRIVACDIDGGVQREESEVGSRCIALHRLRHTRGKR
jgi:hypothetical protein